MRLILVESPTKSKTLKKFLGKEYQVAATMGHIRDLPKSELGVDTENNFKPKYIIPLKSRKIINLLKKETEKAKTIILACDQDREGEAIAWHLSHALRLKELKKPYQRIAFHEITKSAIEKALKNPRQIDLNLVNAQQARRILDRIVGYKLSPFLWKKVARGLSAGRVQSVAVRFVVDREKEIENFTPQEYWTITAQFKKVEIEPRQVLEKSDLNEFEATLVKKDGKIISKLDLKTKKKAEDIVKDLKTTEYKIASIEKKEIKRNPLSPFITSTLQQAAWQKFRWPARSTMQAAQQLYEKGLTTYHRTDSLNISNLALEAAKSFIIKNYGSNYYQFRKYKTKSKTAQEAHEAIRPSYPNKRPEDLKLDERQLKLYDLIWKRFIACQMSQACFDSTTVEIETQNSKLQKPKYTFRASGQILKFDGFLKVYSIKFAGLRSFHASAKASAIEEAELPPLKINEILELIKLIPSQHFTQPLPRFNEASLIKILEKNSVGRPSTYAPILFNIQEKNYIEKDEQKRFRPTEIGLAINNILVLHFPEIVDVGFTSKMEESLDQIAEGKKEWVKIINNFYQPFEKNLKEKYEQVSKKDITEIPTKKICPKCKSPLLIRLGRYGKFYACSDFPKCKHTESLKENSLDINCPKCKKGKIVEKRTKKRKVFYGCDQYPKCNFALWDKPVNKKCSKCGSLLVETKKGTKCSNKECDFRQ